ncbi:MAG: hypothetical protein SGPRY_010890 [Prymnesium sp.]
MHPELIGRLSTEAQLLAEIGVPTQSRYLKEAVIATSTPPPARASNAPSSATKPRALKCTLTCKVIDMNLPPEHDPCRHVRRLPGRPKKEADPAKPAAKLERENAALKETNERLRSAAMDDKKFAQYWSLADPLFEDPQDSATVRKVVVCAHPDKHPGHKAAATTCSRSFAGHKRRRDDIVRERQTGGFYGEDNCMKLQM